MSGIDELRQDCDELKVLLASTSRPNVRQLIAAEITKLEAKINIGESKSTKSSEESSHAPPVNGAAKEQKKSIYTSKLTSYGWDQTNKFVKIYVTLKDVETLPKDDIKVDFTPNSFELTVSNLHGKNYSLTIRGLLDRVVPSESTFKAKSGTVYISLKKESSQSWDCLTASEKKTKETKTPKVDKDADPQASIMSMMKQMYEEGDDDMKRTIAKAWTESRDKQVNPGGLDF